MKKTVLILLFAVLLLASCTTHTQSPYTEEYFFQALGEDGELVITADMEKLKEGDFKDLLPEEDMVLSRTERVSISLLPKDMNQYPSEMDNFVLSGGLEGDYPKFLTNVGLSFSKDFKKVKSDGLKRYAMANGLEAASPVNGLVLFTNGDYKTIYEKTYADRVKRITDETAALMAQADVAFYSKNPKTLMDIGFSLPVLVLQSVRETYLMVSQGDEGYVLDGLLEMNEEAGARIVCAILKSQYIQALRKNGEKLDTQKASGYFTYEGSTIHITAFPLPSTMKEKVSVMLASSLGGII